MMDLHSEELLDIDSTRTGTFDSDDAVWLEMICGLL